MFIYGGWHSFFHSMHRTYCGYFELASVSFQIASENILFPNIEIWMWPFWKIELPVPNELEI